MIEDGTWQPLLQGESAKAAIDVILEIAEALGPENGMRRTSVRQELVRVDLGSGAAGQALLFTYLAQVWPEEKYAAAADYYLEQAIDYLAEHSLTPGLYSGFTGVAWVAEHHRRVFEGADDEDEGEQIDQALLSFLQRQPPPENMDLIDGLVGIGVYALERWPHGAAPKCLEQVIHHLGEMAEQGSDGVTWFVPRQRVPAFSRREFPHGYYDLGVAHGVPGVIAMLAAAVHVGVASEQARRLLEGAVAWLLTRQNPAGVGSCFPTHTGRGIAARASRLAWCYGDPGVAAALLYAARCVGRLRWEERALRVALAAAERPEEGSRVHDAGLCHGSAGLVHLFNRLYQATGRKRLFEAARHWLDRTLEMRQPGKGVAGYSAYFPQGGENPQWIAEEGFLMGTAGIALALLAAVSTVEPRWDRLLFSAIPPRH